MIAKTKGRWQDIKIYKQRNRLRQLDKRLHKHALYNLSHMNGGEAYNCIKN